MRGRRSIIISVVVVLIIGLAGIFLISPEEESMKGMLIFSQVPADVTEMDYRTGGNWRYPPQARIVAVNPEKPAEVLTVLTGEFYSARAPEISYDAKRLLFSGQRTESEPWQIWEMGLENLQARQVTSNLENCTDPAYLPDDRVVFSRLETDTTLGVSHTLYTSTLNGTEVKRITFHPHSNFAPTVLQDGRILMISRQLYPSLDAVTLMVVRPDGTKAELFYKSRENDWPSSRGWETDNGRVVFVESDKNYSSGGNIVSISQGRPLNSRKVLTSEFKENFRSVFPLPSGNFIVSYRQPGVDGYALLEFDPIEKRFGRLIYSDSDFHALEPVMVAERARPKKLPSIVNEQKTTGWLLCLNSDLSDLPTTGNVPSLTKSKKIQVFGLNEVWGDVPIEEDGSFYIEITADTPVRLRTISENGQVVRGPSSWIWVRPNERRGCVGCHEARGLTAENQVPLAINKPPVSLFAPLSQHFVEGNP